MDEAACVALLEEHGVRPTANRIVVAKALASSIQPQSLAELERKISTIDKSNVFRALTLFKEHHLVHAIEGSRTAPNMNSAIVTIMSMMTTSIRISTAKCAMRPTASTIPTCQRFSCLRGSK